MSNYLINGYKYFVVGFRAPFKMQVLASILRALLSKQLPAQGNCNGNWAAQQGQL